MAVAGVVKSLGPITSLFHQRIGSGYLQPCTILLQTREYAARKGTREKAKKKKVKKEVIKVGFIPHNQRVKKSEMLPLSHFKDHDLSKSEKVDNVWIEQFHKSRIYTVEEAIKCHRESHHSTMYDTPDAFVSAFVEIDMQGERATKILEKFTRVVEMPHTFDHGEERQILAFARDPLLLELADKAGATLTGDRELIKKIQSGEVSVNDFQYVIAHPDIMADLSVIRGLLKRKYPNPRSGTLGLHLPNMVKRIFNSVKYTVMIYPKCATYGTTTVNFGRLNMDIQKLEENFAVIIEDIEKARPKRDGEFIFRSSIQSLPTTESFKVDYQNYIKRARPDEDSDDDEVNAVASAT